MHLLQLRFWRKTSAPLRRLRSVFVAPIVLAGLVMPAIAKADVAPPDAYVCDNSAAPGHFDATKIGTSCDVRPGARGTCQKSTCQGIDYANWDRDASATAPSITFDCLRCVENDASAPVTNGADAGGGDGGGNGGGATPGGSSNHSGCNVTSTSTIRAAAPWLIALLVPAIAFATKRRRRHR